MTLLVRRSGVSGLLDLRQAMAVLEQTFREQSEGKVKVETGGRFDQRGAAEVAEVKLFRLFVCGAACRLNYAEEAAEITMM